MSKRDEKRPKGGSVVELQSLISRVTVILGEFEEILGAMIQMLEEQGQSANTPAAIRQHVGEVRVPLLTADVRSQVVSESEDRMLQLEDAFCAQVVAARDILRMKGFVGRATGEVDRDAFRQILQIQGFDEEWEALKHSLDAFQFRARSGGDALHS